MVVLHSLVACCDVVVGSWSFIVVRCSMCVDLSLLVYLVCSLVVTCVFACWLFLLVVFVTCLLVMALGVNAVLRRFAVDRLFSVARCVAFLGGWLLFWCVLFVFRWFFCCLFVV